MKKSLLVVLALSFALVFAVGCGADDPEVYDEPVIEEPVVEESSDAMQDFIDTQNAMFEDINSPEMTIYVSAAGTVVTYTYTFNFEGLDDAMMQTALDAVADEGQALLDMSRLAVPEITAVVLEFKGADGTDLGTSTFE